MSKDGNVMNHITWDSDDDNDVSTDSDNTLLGERSTGPTEVQRPSGEKVTMSDTNQ
jgi:hypothetical protein